VYYYVHTGDVESDDELSTGAMVAISSVVTFIIIIVPVTAVVAIMCYKHRCKHKDNNEVTRTSDRRIPTAQDVKMGDNPSNATTQIEDYIKIEPDPVYAIMDKDTIKIETDPAYAIMDKKIETDPAYVVIK